MVNNKDWPTVIASVPYQALVGSVLSFVPGYLGTYVVRHLEGHPSFDMPSRHPLVTCTTVMAIALPTLGLYKLFLEEDSSKALRRSAFGIIFLGTSLTVLKFSNVDLTPLRALALSLTYLFWQIFIETDVGKKIMKVN